MTPMGRNEPTEGNPMAWVRHHDRYQSASVPYALSRFGDRLARPVLFGSVVAASWVFVIQSAGTGMSVAAMPTWQVPPPLDRPVRAAHWDVAHATAMILMWWIMMLPGVAATARQHAIDGIRLSDGLRFCLGYATGWLAFSFSASAMQAILERTGRVDGMKRWSASADFSSLLLAAVGLYQISGAKTRNLARCRANTGSEASATDGLRHALHCLTNSAPLMSLLFVGGIMNIVGLSAANLLERKLARPRLFSKGGGVACIATALMIARPGG